jgi:hypothetical protein
VALTESLMSQDEDEVDEKGQKTGRFISHAGTYRSDLVSLTAAAETNTHRIVDVKVLGCC